MQWKPYYDAELRRPESRKLIVDWLREASEDTELSSPVGGRLVLSFPHTAIAYSGAIQARVVAALYRANVSRVIALGVMHGGLVPVYRVATDESASEQKRADAFAQVSGAFLPFARHLETPFGSLAVDSMAEPLPDGVGLDTADLLREEFSLDTFCSVLRLAADDLGVEPLPVLPLFVGMTRHPITGSFETAVALSKWLSAQWDDDTAIVTTGDVVHYGEVYGSAKESVSRRSLESRFRVRLDDSFTKALEERDLETAYQISLHELKSDQRELLPVLAHLLGKGADADVLSFELSDYAAIFDTDSPCLVASALIAYKKRNA